MRKARISTEVAEQIVVSAPGSDAPGYLRRQQTALALQRDMRDLQKRAAAASASGGVVAEGSMDELNEATASMLDQLVEFVLDYVTVPKDRAAAKALLLELSENALMRAFNAVKAGATAPPLPASGTPKKGASAAGSTGTARRPTGR